MNSLNKDLNSPDDPETPEEDQSLFRHSSVEDIPEDDSGFLSRGMLSENITAVLADGSKVATIIQSFRLLYGEIPVPADYEVLKMAAYLPIATAAGLFILNKLESYHNHQVRFQLPRTLSLVPETLPMKKLLIESPVIIAWLWFLNQVPDSIYQDESFKWFPVIVVAMVATIFHSMVPVRIFEEEAQYED